MAAAFMLAQTACASAADQIVLQGEPVQGALVRGTATPGSIVTLEGAPLMVDSDGKFAFGFDRDASGTVTLKTTAPGGTEEVRTLTIAPREWQIERVDGLPEETVTPPPETAARIAREAEMKRAARKRDTQGSWFTQSFAWPAQGRISGVFGSQRILNGEPRRPHYGVDVAALEGTPIHAPAGGIVTLAEPDLYFEGGIVFIDHGHGLITYIMHMSKVEAHVGQEVKQGDIIGEVGATGRANGPHMHWGMWWLDAHIDPELLVPPMPARPAPAETAQ